MAFLPPSSDPIFRSHDDDNPQAAGFGEFMVMRRSSMSMSYSDDEGSEDGSHMVGVGEKKRRLNLEQVKALERSFESGNKLEPERKMQLARALGLQPRQIAIWFQNRRARWKTKQLERDHDLLKRQFDALKADNDALVSHNKNLQSQLLALKAARDSAGPINLNKDSEQGSENSGGEVNLNTASTAAATTLHPNHHHHHHQRHDYGNNEHQIMKNGVAFSSSMGPSSTDTSLTQLLHSSSRTACHHHHHRHHLQQQQHEAPVLNDCFCSVMFGGIDESPEFWPWPEQQNFQ